MPLIPLSQITHAEVIVYGLIASAGAQSKNTVNTFHYRRTNTSNPLVKSDLMNIFSPVVLSKIAALLNARWASSHLTARWMDDATDIPQTLSMVAVGAITGDSMPASVSVFLYRQTGLKGKHYRGGSKLGPMSESDTTAGTDDILNAAALGRLQALANACFQPLVDASGNNWVPCLYSRKLSQPLVNPTTIVTNDLTNILPRKNFGRLKKRLMKSTY